MHGKSSHGTPSVSATTEFFDAVLPQDGYLCLWVMDGPKRDTYWYSDTASMAAAALKMAERDVDVYFAVASFKDTSARKERNVLSHAALKLDLDVKPGCYSSQEEATISFERFCKQNKLPDALLVSSGYGLHAYFLLAEDISTLDWRKLAAALTSVAQTDGLHIDAGVCKTAAGVLRPIGAVNCKQLPYRAPVEYLGEPDFTRHPLSVFDCLGVSTARTSMSLGAVPAHLRGQTDDLNKKGIAPTEPSDPRAIAAQCGQIGRFDKSNGSLPYETWRSCVALLAWATNGDELAHAWSEPHNSYDERETQQKIDDSLKASGPVTCAHFASLDVQAESPCTTCPFRGKVTSPLELGRAPYIKVPEVPASVPLPNSADLLGETCPPAPQGYTLSERGVKRDPKDGEVVGATIAPYPLYLQTISRSERFEGGTQLTFRTYHPQEGWRTVTVGYEALHNKPGGVMAKENVNVNAKLFLDFVNRSHSELQKRRKTEQMFSNYGWKGNDFLLGNRLYSNGVPTSAPVSDEARNRLGYFFIRGDGNIWKDAVEHLFRKGCEVQSFAVLAAFAAPLMKFADDTEGGAILALVSRKSSKGKSAAMLAGQTIWGDPKGVSFANSATENSRPIIFGSLSALPIFWDEATQKDPMVARTRVEDFQLGTGKDRATREGGIQHNTLNWRTILITGSNTSLVDTITAGSGSDAMAYRIFELTAELPSEIDISKGDVIKRQMVENLGHAGDQMLRYLTRADVLPVVKKMVAAEVTRMQSEHGFVGPFRYWSRLLACVSVAGKIVERLGLLTVSTQRIVDWAIAYAKEESERITSVKSGDMSDVFAQYLGEKANSIIVVQHEYRHKQTQTPRFRPQGAIAGRYELETKTLYLSTAGFNKWLAERDYGAREVIAELEAAGVMKYRSRLTLGAGTDYATMQTGVYVMEVDWEPPSGQDQMPSNVVQMRR